jgi:heme-degrading monooxygenase HmoA
MLIDISGNPAITDHPNDRREVNDIRSGTEIRHDEGGAMIARIWKGAVRRPDGDAYAQYMRRTGVAGYAETPGNRGVWMLRRDVEDRTEFVMFTLWDSLAAVKAFAGEDYETAVFYPDDDRFLVERDLEATHYEVDTQVATGSG